MAHQRPACDADTPRNLTGGSSKSCRVTVK